MEVVRHLRKAGVDVEHVHHHVHVADDEIDAILDLRLEDLRSRFAVEERRRSPYPNELARLAGVRQRLSHVGRPLLVVPFVSETLGEQLTAAGWSWADSAGNFDLRATGLLLRCRCTGSPPKAKRTIPQGTGSLAIIRALIGFVEGESEELAATTLAAQANVTQPRASQVLHQLQDLALVERRNGRWVPDREALLDRFLVEYRGPRGSEQRLYSLDPPAVTAKRLASLRLDPRRAVVSADVGPDLLVGWRRPTVVVIYTTEDLEPKRLGLVAAQGVHDANVVLRHPDDLSVFPVPQLVGELDGVEISLAAPTQQMWDLLNLGGADREETAGRLREWLLTHH